MQIKENSFIKLSDDKVYIVANILEYRGAEYAYLVSVDDQKLTYSFCTETIGKDGKSILNSVTDKYLTERLKSMFSANMQEKIEKLKDENNE